MDPLFVSSEPRNEFDLSLRLEATVIRRLVNCQAVSHARRSSIAYYDIYAPKTNDGRHQYSSNVKRCEDETCILRILLADRSNATFGYCHEMSSVVCNTRILWPNRWTDQDETWHAGRPRPSPHCVRWKPNSPPPKGHSLPPIFGPYLLRPNGCMDQDVTWYGARPRPRQLVLDGDPAPPCPKGGRSPQIFGPCLLWPNGCMDQDASWYADRP